MNARNITETIGIVLPSIGIILFFMGYRSIALLSLIIWYLGFGFVGLAFYSYQHKNYKASMFFLSITVPNILLPFRRSFYFWLKTWNAIFLGQLSNEAMWEGLSKVDPNYLGTDDNKARYYMTLAALYLDMKKQIDARMYAQIAYNHAKDANIRNAIEDLMSKISNAEQRSEI